MTGLQHLPALRRVAVCGGTHGNEMSGVYLAKHWLRNPSELQRETFHATPFLGNPLAAEQCVRYLGRDLNRVFTADILNYKVSDSDSYECQRAQEINQTFGPKGSSKAYDFMLDLHNTTANMGSCLMVASEDDILPMHMCNYIQKQSKMEPSSILLYQQPQEETYSVVSVAKAGLALCRGRLCLIILANTSVNRPISMSPSTVTEMGPQPQGVARADLLAEMRSTVAYVLDFIELFNKGTLFPAFETEAYKIVGSVDFPRDPSGEISAVVHAKLQDKDFQPLKPGDPIFQTLDGDDILYEGEDTIHPAFINEAAYYEKKVAFFKTEKQTLFQPALQKKF